MVIGFFLIVGTAGASDLDLITVKEIILKGGSGLLLILTGYVGLRLGGCEYVY